jgi:hypothetical protein
MKSTIKNKMIPDPKSTKLAVKQRAASLTRPKARGLKTKRGATL